MTSKKLGSVKRTDTVIATSVDLSADVGSSVLPVANGGTGTGTFTDGQLLIGKTSGNTVAKSTLTGTANQVVVTNGSGAITLSLPQSIDTAASTQFGRVSVGRSQSTYGLEVYNVTSTAFANVESGNSGSNGSVRVANPSQAWVFGVRGDLSNAFALADSTASAIRWYIDTSGNIAYWSTTIPSGAARTLVLGGSTTTPTLGAATTDTVSLGAIDNGAGNREFQVQPESGGLLTWGSNKLRMVPTANQDLSRSLPTVNTTDATVTTLVSIAITSGSTYLIESRVIARRTGGSAGTADDGASYVRRATYTTKSGTVTLMGSVQTIGTDAEEQAGWDCTLDINSGNVRVRVTGATNNNITWLGDITVQRVAS